MWLRLRKHTDRRQRCVWDCWSWCWTLTPEYRNGSKTEVQHTWRQQGGHFSIQTHIQRLHPICGHTGSQPDENIMRKVQIVEFTPSKIKINLLLEFWWYFLVTGLTAVLKIPCNSLRIKRFKLWINPNGFFQCNSLAKQPELLAGLQKQELQFLFYSTANK